MIKFYLLPKLLWSALLSRSNQAFYDRISSIYDSVFISHEVHAHTIAGTLGDMYSGKENQTLVLDLGCGTGMLTRMLSDKGFRVVGLDISFQSLCIAKKKMIQAALVQADAENLPIANGCLNSVVCLGVWRHFSDQTKVLDEIARVLLGDGSLIIGYFPPAIGGLIHTGHSRFSGLVAQIYNMLTAKLGYTDRADNLLEQEVTLAAEKYFKVVKSTTSGSHWRIILNQFPRNREIQIP